MKLGANDWVDVSEAEVMLIAEIHLLEVANGKRRHKASHKVACHRCTESINGESHRAAWVVAIDARDLVGACVHEEGIKEHTKKAPPLGGTGSGVCLLGRLTAPSEDDFTQADDGTLQRKHLTLLVGVAAGDTLHRASDGHAATSGDTTCLKERHQRGAVEVDGHRRGVIVLDWAGDDVNGDELPVTTLDEFCVQDATCEHHGVRVSPELALGDDGVSDSGSSGICHVKEPGDFPGRENVLREGHGRKKPPTGGNWLLLRRASLPAPQGCQSYLKRSRLRDLGSYPSPRTEHPLP